MTASRPGSPDTRHPCTSTMSQVRRGLSGMPRYRQYREQFDRWMREEIQRQPPWAFLRTRMEVNDVVNEVWSRFLDGRGFTGFDNQGHGAFHGLMRTIIANTMGDLRDRHGAKKRGSQAQHLSIDPTGRIDPADGFGELVSMDPTASEELVLAEHLAFLRRVLRTRHSERNFNVWRLRVEWGYSSGEIATHLGISVDAVDAAYRRVKVDAIRFLTAPGRGA